MLERVLLYVLRAEPRPLSKLRRVYPFAFRPTARFCVRARVRFRLRFCGRWVAGSVLIEYSRAGRRSMAMKLRRELSPQVFVVVARQLRISAQIIFFQLKEGVRSGKGARACG